MYLTAHRVRRIKGNETKVGINAFLHRHSESDLPRNTRFDKEEIVEKIANNNTGKLVAELTDLVPGGSSVLSFVDIVGREDLDKEHIQDFLDQMEPEIEGIHTPITKPGPDLAVRFEIVRGLEEHGTREYKALTERAMRLFQSPEPPKWRSENPWIVIERKTTDTQETFSLSSEAADNLRQIHNEPWIPKRISVEHGTKIVAEEMYGDLIQYIAPVVTGLALEQIAAHGGLILHDFSSEKKIKWPELTEL